MPRNDSAVFNYSSVDPKIRRISEHDFDTVSIEVQNSGIEVINIVGARSWGAIGSASSIQGSGVKSSNGSSTWSGEGNVCGAGVYTVYVVS